MRYMDYCIKTFMQNAAKQNWYSNTIFLLIGDHGIRGNGGTLIPTTFTNKGLTCMHVPLLIYSPLLAPAQHNFVCSQIDVLPTLAGLAGIQYTNTTLGRNLIQLASDSTQPNYAFIYNLDDKEYGVIDNNYYYYQKQLTKENGLINWHTNKPQAVTPYYTNLAKGIYNTASYMIYNNSKLK